MDTILGYVKVNMQIIIDLLILLGIGYSIHYQRKKINSLETTIDSQSTIIESMKKYVEIIDIDQIKKYVSIKEEMATISSEQKVSEILNELKQKERNFKDFSKNQIEALGDLVAFSISILTKLPVHLRQPLAKDLIRNETVREIVLSQIRNFKDVYHPISLLDMVVENQRVTSVVGGK